MEREQGTVNRRRWGRWLNIRRCRRPVSQAFRLPTSLRRRSAIPGRDNIVGTDCRTLSRKRAADRHPGNKDSAPVTSPPIGGASAAARPAAARRAGRNPVRGNSSTFHVSADLGCPTRFERHILAPTLAPRPSAASLTTAGRRASASSHPRPRPCAASCQRQPNIPASAVKELGGSARKAG